jgi:hypothetical protein
MSFVGFRLTSEMQQLQISPYSWDTSFTVGHKGTFNAQSNRWQDAALLIGSGGS